MKGIPIFIQEKKNVVVARLVMLFAPKKLFLWLRMKRDLPIHLLMRIDVFAVVNA